MSVTRPIPQDVAVSVDNLASGGVEDRVASGSIPFACLAESRIDVGLAGGNCTEFEGAAAPYDLLDLVLGDELFQFFAASIFTGHHR